jgi:hypothetical protein
LARLPIARRQSFSEHPNAVISQDGTGMKKTYVVYEIHWEQCEYGGLSKSCGSTLHLTYDAALQYKRDREGDLINRKWPPDDPFYDRGSNPVPKTVSKSVYKTLKQESGEAG